MYTYELNGATRIPYSVPHPDPWGRLDKSMSPGVENFAQKNYPPPKYPGGTIGVALNKAITDSQSVHFYSKIIQHLFLMRILLY